MIRTITRSDLVQSADDVEPFAWPGGEPIAYYTMESRNGHDFETTGDVLCADCAKERFDLETDETTGLLAQSTDSYDAVYGALTCDNCYCDIVPQLCDTCLDPWKEKDGEPVMHDDGTVTCGECAAK